MSDEKELTLYLTQTEFNTLNWALMNLEQFLDSKKDFKKISELRNNIVDQVMQNHDFKELEDNSDMKLLLMTTDEKKALVRKAYFVFRRDQQQKCIDCADDATKKQKQADLAREERGY